jgi:hypothetical protein
MPDGAVKQEVRQLLNKLITEIKKIDSLHMEMIYTRQLPTLGGDIKQEISIVRRQLETKIKDWNESKK